MSSNKFISNFCSAWISFSLFKLSLHFCTLNCHKSTFTVEKLMDQSYSTSCLGLSRDYSKPMLKLVIVVLFIVFFSILGLTAFNKKNGNVLTCLIQVSSLSIHTLFLFMVKQKKANWKFFSGKNWHLKSKQKRTNQKRQSKNYVSDNTDNY